MALKATTNRVPQSITGIANMMEMDTAEIQAWPYLSEVRMAIKDYNIGYIAKQILLSRLEDIAVKNSSSEKNLQHYADAITENMLPCIKLSY